MIGIFYVVLSSICFGIMPLLAKIAYGEGMNTYEVLFLRFIFAVIILAVYLIIKKIYFKIELKQLGLLICICVFGYSLTSLSLFLSYNYIAIGLSTIILYTYPIVVTILSFFIYKEKISLNKIFSLIFSVIGIILLTSINSSSFNIKGVILAFVASLAFSFYVIGVSGKRFKDINNFLITFYMSLISAVVILVYSSINNNFILKITTKSIICVVLLTIISTVIGLVTFVKGVKLIGSSKASILSTLEPVVSIILGTLVLNEKLTISMIIGSIFIILALIILNLRIVKR